MSLESSCFGLYFGRKLLYTPIIIEVTIQGERFSSLLHFGVALWAEPSKPLTATGGVTAPDGLESSCFLALRWCRKLLSTPILIEVTMRGGVV